MTGGFRSGVYLEGFADPHHLVWRTPVERLPFRIGRRADADLVLLSPRVSHLHAEIHRDAHGLWLVDLASTNGCFVNGDRVAGPRRIVDGDVIHFADQEFRLVELVRAGDEPGADPTSTKTISSARTPSRYFEQARHFRDMLAGGRVYAQFQPIVRLSDGGIVGYEALGRGQLDGSEAYASVLFEIAESLELAVDLSAMMRARSLELAARLPESATLYLNTHPAELWDGTAFLEELAAIRRRLPARGLVLEIHERAVADLAAFGRLRREMEQLDIGIAFDDFGTGQARLLELVDVAPSCVKFDRAWVSGIDHATPRRRALVEQLLATLADLGVVAAAEGVETAGEAATCRELGFELAQGYYFGRPESL